MKYFVIKLDDGTFAVKSARNFRPKNAVAVVPNSINPEDHQFIEVDEFYDEETKKTEYIVGVDEVRKENTLAKKNKELEVNLLYTDYVEEVYKEMKFLFGTTNDARASALSQTWQLMRISPELYVGKNRKDDNGVVLDTTSKIYEYADDKVKKLVDYSIFLEERRRQFDKDVADLGV